MGVDNIRLLTGNNPLQHPAGPVHGQPAAPVEGGGVVADASRLHLGHVNPTVGDNYNIVVLILQLLGQLHNVGLRPADVQAHGGHHDLHGFLSFRNSAAHPASPSPAGRKRRARRCSVSEPVNPRR